MDNPIQWKWGLLAAFAISLLALYPQVHFQQKRGPDWNGAGVLTAIDETAYAAYINALIDGRPRRNDPYTGRDDNPESPQPESLFSIQFVPAYMISAPARALGLSASTAFTALTPIAAFASALAIFWLIVTLTNDSRLAAAGVIVVLSLGAFAGGAGIVNGLLDSSGVILYNPPFLRRYQPAATFPLFFIFCGLVWRALTASARRSSLVASLLSGALFALLVFSYFYLWTAAAAWLFCLVVLWFVGRPRDWRRCMASIAPIGLFAVGAVIPYFILLSHRAPTMDSRQALILSRSLDLFRTPEIIGVVVCALLFYAVKRGVVEKSNSLTLFAASFAITPFLIFNQQVGSGRSLQPVHYEAYIANYMALIAVVLMVALPWRGIGSEPRRVPRRLLVLASVLCFAWMTLEVMASAVVYFQFNKARDESLPVIERLASLVPEDGRFNNSNENSDPRPVVFSTDLEVADNIPGSAPQAVLWAVHTASMSGAALGETRTRLYHQLYYSGIDAESFPSALEDRKWRHARIILFGSENVITGLSLHPDPVTAEDVLRETQPYSDFISTFSKYQATHPTLSYVVAPVDAQPDWTNLDRWYERDQGEQIGKYILYRVNVR